MSSPRLPQTHEDPLWYKDAIIYELHVRAFYDSNGDGKQPDQSCHPERQNFLHENPHNSTRKRAERQAYCKSTGHLHPVRNIARSIPGQISFNQGE